MDPPPFEQLTERQKICLRLVFQHKSSKEIARELGISKDTVDQRLDRARKLLGAATRVEAAQAFASFESEYHRVVYDTAPIAPSSTSPPATSLSDTEERQFPRTPLLREEGEAHTSSSTGRGWLGLPFQRRGEERIELSVRQRLLWIALIAVGIPLLLGSLISGLLALGRIAVALKDQLS